MSNKKIANTYNFFEINTDEQKAVFWGLDISSKLIPLTERVLNSARRLNLPFNEVVEIYDDNTLKFFNGVYY